MRPLFVSQNAPLLAIRQVLLDVRVMQIVSVLIPLALPGPYDYGVPDAMTLGEGDVVRVPLGPREVFGVVWGPGEGRQSPAKLNP